MGQEILTGPERRRRWSVEEKLSILGEVGRNGHSVSDVARRHDITRQHIYQWRAALRRGRLPVSQGLEFLTVEVSDDGPEGVAGPEALTGSYRTEQQVEIAVAKGRVIRVPIGLPSPVLSRLIRTVEDA